MVEWELCCTVFSFLCCALSTIVLFCKFLLLVVHLCWTFVLSVLFGFTHSDYLLGFSS